MSNTNLTDGSQLCFCYLNCERNYLKDGEKPGDATKIEEKGDLSVAKGVSPMDITANSVVIDENGNRDDGTKILDNAEVGKKRARMKEFNKVKSKAKGKRPSGNGHEDR